MSDADVVVYLQSLKSVRERCASVYRLAEQQRLDYWDLDLSKEAEIVDFTCSLIAVSWQALAGVMFRLTWLE